MEEGLDQSFDRLLMMMIALFPLLFSRLAVWRRSYSSEQEAEILTALLLKIQVFVHVIGLLC